MKTRVAILGATGYGGGELLRLLLSHPAVDVVYATSRTAAGKHVSSVHRNLEGVTSLEFSAPSQQDIIDNVDVVFGALPHGASAENLAPFYLAGKRVIDLSGDFRLHDAPAYTKWYKREHPCPELLAEAVYGMPEMNAEAIRSARLVASPGCFATAINLALFPFAKAGLAVGRPQIVAMTGSSGSGAEATLGTHHPLRAQTIRPYKVLSHQHVGEVLQTAEDAGSRLDGLDFTPVSAPVVRGIMAIATIPLKRALSQQELDALVDATYASAPFVKVIRSREPEVQTVATTNWAEFRARVMDDQRVHVVTTIDNLIKGASGQAIQSLNLMLGLPETTGLEWTGTWP